MFDKARDRIRQAAKTGAGSCLAAMLKEVNIPTCPSCRKTMAMMDTEGVEWCVRYRSLLIETIKNNIAKNRSVVVRAFGNIPNAAIRPIIGKALDRAIEITREMI